MCNFICGVVTSVIGAILVVVVSVVTFTVVPGLVETMIENEVILLNDTIQFDRFETIPFPLNFTVRVWNITNAAEVLSGGVPIVNEVGPFVYRVEQHRVIESIDEDEITYRIIDHFEFDAVASYPNTEEDVVAVANVPYNAILQVAESMFPLLMGAVNSGINGIFGQHNTPIMQVPIRTLLFDGIPICENPDFLAAIVCIQIRSLGDTSQNLVQLEDGSMLFSLLAHKDGNLSPPYVVSRGLTDSADLARISMFDGLPHLNVWPNINNTEFSRCNMLNGTDSGIFAPFVDREASLYALNTDICRSVELRYQYDLEYEGIPAVRYSANEWFLENQEGCFCLGVTRGIVRPNGCLFQGAMELFNCVGAFLVLSYPHFLYADFRYRNGVLGLHPVEEEHRIFVDLEPNTGTVVRGMKRGQFNIFLRPITGIPSTASLGLTLTPLFWVEEGMSLPEVYVDEIRSRLLLPLTLVDIMLPIAIALCAVILLVGIILAVRAKMRTPGEYVTGSPTPRTAMDRSTIL